MELAQENYFTIKTNPSFNRDSCRDGQEILEVIRAFDQKTYGTGAAAAVVQREIGELAKLADRNTMPDTLKSIIREVTAPKNIGQLDMKIWTPGRSTTTPAPRTSTRSITSSTSIVAGNGGSAPCVTN